ncbi:MAG: N-acetyl-alpha-D-glucosaminyl L-malate synthase BshA [Acidobacteriia bacterium]|nr:N-acetyl-alpha-D-glucosaminyl L-malate synthase BshA [Terriglobia bacterium]
MSRNPPSPLPATTRDPLRIAIACYPSVGGSGILASQLGQQLALRGHQVHFVSYEKPFRLDLSAANVFFHPVVINEYDLFRYPDYTLPLSAKLAELGRAHRLDLIHAHYAVPHAVAAYLAQQMLGEAAPRLITTLHGTDTTLMGKDPGYQPVIRHAIEHSDGVTAVSRYLREETLIAFGSCRDIRVIHNFFAPTSPTRTRRQVRDELGFGDEFVVIHMSNLRPGKRIHDLLRVIAASRHRERIRLLILAGGDFAPYRPLAEALGIEPRVTVLASVPDIENYLDAADLGLYTSDHESFGLSILESMFHRLPVLATRTGGVPEVVADGENGFLLPVGDIEGFAGRLDAIIEDPERYRFLGEKGGERARALFSAERIVGEYLDFYRQVIESKERPRR